MLVEARALVQDSHRDVLVVELEPDLDEQFLGQVVAVLHGVGAGLDHRMAVPEIDADPLERGRAQRAVRVLEIFEIGRMGAGGVITVEAVFREELPVAANRIFLRAADDLHSARAVL